MYHANHKQTILQFVLFLLSSSYFRLCYSAQFFNEESVPNLHVWITISSLAHKDPSNSKNYLIRRVELNWINAPLDDPNEYIALYLDSEPDFNTLPVVTHKVNDQVHGMVTTDYYLPQLDFYNNESDGSINNEITNHHHEVEDRYSRSHHYQELYPSHKGQEAQFLIDECLGYCLAYLNRGKILAKNCFKTNPNWMGDMYKFVSTRTLPNIMLPGTHNSGTYQRFIDESSLQHINKYQVNQEESIFNQLVYGIRHLDLRVGYTKVEGRHENLWIYHDIFRTDVSVEEVCQQVRKFLSMTTHEVIIMDFHRFTVGFQNQDQATLKDRHDQLVQLIARYLGQYIAPSYLGYQASIHEFVSSNRRLLIGYANKAAIFSSAPSNSIDIEGQHPSATDLESEGSSWLLSSRNRYPQIPSSSIANEASLFHSSVWHLWPNKDTLAGLAQYMNESTCRMYFGELRSMMAELTPSVFGAITDKYDGNRHLAQLVNRPVTDWIRDRWWHCINIVATDFFLGNDLIRLAMHANRLRITRYNTDPNSYKCSSFRKIEHLLDKRSIPSSYIEPDSSNTFVPSPSSDQTSSDYPSSGQEGEIMIKTRSATNHHYRPYEKRTASSSSFVNNVADGFSNLFISFKRLLNL